MGCHPREHKRRTWKKIGGFTLGMSYPKADFAFQLDCAAHRLITWQAVRVEKYWDANVIHWLAKSTWQVSHWLEGIHVSNLCKLISSYFNEAHRLVTGLAYGQSYAPTGYGGQLYRKLITAYTPILL